MEKEKSKIAKWPAKPAIVSELEPRQNSESPVGFPLHVTGLWLNYKVLFKLSQESN